MGAVTLELTNQFSETFRRGTGGIPLVTWYQGQPAD